MLTTFLYVTLQGLNTALSLFIGIACTGHYQMNDEKRMASRVFL